MNAQYKYCKIHKSVNVPVGAQQYFVRSRSEDRFVGIAEVTSHHCTLPGLESDQCALAVKITTNCQDNIPIIALGTLRSLNLGQSLKVFLIE